MNTYQTLFCVSFRRRETLDLDTRLLAKVHEHFRKIHPLHFLNKRKNISPLATTEAVKDLAIRRHMKRRRLLSMKRTKRTKPMHPSRLQFQILTNHGDDIELCLDW